MKIRSVSYFLAIALSVGLVGCQQPGGTASITPSTTAAYSTKALPESLTVSMPASLSGSGTMTTSSAENVSRSAAAVAGGYALPPRSTQGTFAYDPKDGGYCQIEQVIAQLDDSVPMLETYAILADAAISQNSLAAG
jgi:hypothetical protein